MIEHRAAQGWAAFWGGGSGRNPASQRPGHTWGPWPRNIPMLGPLYKAGITHGFGVTQCVSFTPCSDAVLVTTESSVLMETLSAVSLQGAI